jgi:integrase
VGVYTRKDSPWWWLWLERPGQPGLRERTAIRHEAPTAAQRKALRDLAEAAYRVRMAELARGTYALPGARPAITFARFADWYEAHVSAHQAGAVREREILTTLRATFGPLALADVTRDRVREWMTRRSQTVRPATVNRELDLLKSLLREAVPAYLETSPVAGMRRLPAKRPAGTDAADDEVRVLTHEEETRLLEALSDPRDRALVLAAIDTMARLSSLLGLTWRDDRGAHLVFRRTKNGTTYKVPISTRLRTALDGMPDRDPVYVFAHRRTATLARDWRGVVGNVLERACARAGVTFGREHGGITFHSFRHTGASRMIAAGVDLRTVQELGGWSDIRLLMRYVHPTSEAKRRAVETVSER